MNKVIEKVIYPLFGEEKEKEAFYEKKKSLAEEATKVDSAWENFYLRTEYTLPNGEKWFYYEDTEYGVPYSLERVA